MTSSRTGSLVVTKDGWLEYHLTDNDEDLCLWRDKLDCLSWIAVLPRVDGQGLDIFTSSDSNRFTDMSMCDTRHKLIKQHTELKGVPGFKLQVNSPRKGAFYLASRLTEKLLKVTLSAAPTGLDYSEVIYAEFTSGELALGYKKHVPARV